MKKLSIAFITTLAAANLAYADCASDLQKFNESKTFILENAASVTSIGNNLNVAITKDINIDNNRMFEGSIRELDDVSAKIKANRDKLDYARKSYQAAKCGGDAAAKKK